MGGQRAEDERDGAAVGLDEADARRGERFAGGEAGGAGVGARTAARTGEGAAAEAAEAAAPVGDAVGKPTVPAAGSGPDAEDARAAVSAEADDELPGDLTDSEILGRRLSLARQYAGMSVDEVAAVTRIRPGMVREIEAGDFAHCGGDVYARGHVRAIAKCVGIDPEPLIAAHPPVVPTELPARPRSRIVARNEPAAAKPSPASSNLPESAAVPTSAARDKAAGFAARVPSRVIRPAAEGAASAGKGFAAPSKKPATAAAAGSGSVRPPQPKRKDDPGKIERQPKSANWTAAMLVVLLGLVVFAGVQLIGGDSGKPTAAAVPPPAAKPAAVKPPAAPAPVPKDVEVRIVAIGANSWLNVTGQDGRVLFDDNLPAGATQSFKDAKQLGVTLGNASAVHLFLNGKDLGAAGGAGQVVHWTLNPTGAVNH